MEGDKYIIVYIVGNNMKKFLIVTLLILLATLAFADSQTDFDDSMEDINKFQSDVVSKLVAYESQGIDVSSIDNLLGDLNKEIDQATELYNDQKYDDAISALEDIKPIVDAIEEKLYDIQDDLDEEQDASSQESHDDGDNHDGYEQEIEYPDEIDQQGQDVTYDDDTNYRDATDYTDDYDDQRVLEEASNLLQYTTSYYREVQRMIDAGKVEDVSKAQRLLDAFKVELSHLEQALASRDTSKMKDYIFSVEQTGRNLEEYIGHPEAEEIEYHDPYSVRAQVEESLFHITDYFNEINNRLDDLDKKNVDYSSVKDLLRKLEEKVAAMDSAYQSGDYDLALELMQDEATSELANQLENELERLNRESGDDESLKPDLDDFDSNIDLYLNEMSQRMDRLRDQGYDLTTINNHFDNLINEINRFYDLYFNREYRAATELLDGDALSGLANTLEESISDAESKVIDSGAPELYEEELDEIFEDISEYLREARDQIQEFEQKGQDASDVKDRYTLLETYVKDAKELHAVGKDQEARELLYSDKVYAAADKLSEALYSGREDYGDDDYEIELEELNPEIDEFMTGVALRLEELRNEGKDIDELEKRYLKLLGYVEAAKDLMDLGQHGAAWDLLHSDRIVALAELVEVEINAHA
jgi:hypothetical protein